MATKMGDRSPQINFNQILEGIVEECLLILLYSGETAISN